MEQKEFYCPLYDGMIKKYDCDEISYGAESGRYVNDGLPYLMPIEKVFAKRELCLSCEHQAKKEDKFYTKDRYYASIDRLAVYRIDNDFNGYYINASLTDWVRNQDVLRVPYDTTHYDDITSNEAKAILESWGKVKALNVFVQLEDCDLDSVKQSKQLIAAIEGKDLTDESIHDLAMLIQQTVMENNAKRK